MLLTKTAAGIALLAGLVAAHPGHSVAQEAAERRAYLQDAKRTSLAHCADKLRARGVAARNAARREAVVQNARQKRGLLEKKKKKRDLDDVLATSHNMTEEGYSRDTDPATLFAGYHSCVLTPEVTQGPYYVAGEYVRENVVEDQPGVPLLLDYQVIDVATCEPVPNVYLEMWHCNATGVYGGVVARGNGNAADTGNLDKTFLRGIQPTDADGVAQFESVFPGHYTGRAPHIHVMAHANATLQANGTLGRDNYASHVGQAFFDQALIAAVEKTAPYSTNAQPLTANADDGILAQEAATTTDGVDPVMEYTLLGDSVEDGLFAWLAFGIDSSRSEAVIPAVYYYKEGGVANEDSPGGGGPGGFPSGGPGADGPTGSAPGAAPTN
ncbi:Intradiol ring-cleavage dioxygenase-like protein [Chaetomium strumarium]|uniref:Intradiol ring-cleavage dioxygenase-like protein n=1 Tax=Chaetomium strumarium TaxID=1170767 RepID=A0AAJ0GWR0_9PEZI|nr:Intradiol ring-cleavage dioxygenase-like protein [Chaetomium strumarium]